MMSNKWHADECKFTLGRQFNILNVSGAIDSVTAPATNFVPSLLVTDSDLGIPVVDTLNLPPYDVTLSQSETEALSNGLLDREPLSFSSGLAILNVCDFCSRSFAYSFTVKKVSSIAVLSFYSSDPSKLNHMYLWLKHIDWGWTPWLSTFQVPAASCDAARFLCLHIAKGTGATYGTEVSETNNYQCQDISAQMGCTAGNFFY